MKNYFQIIALSVIVFFLNPSITNAQWIQTNGPCNGNVWCVASSGGYLFAGTVGGLIFRSTNNGTSWTSVFYTGLDNDHVFSIASLGTSIFAGTFTGGVYRSTNNGTSWTAVNNGLTSTIVRAFAVLGSNLFSGTDGEGVFLSTNNGANWNAVNNGLSNHQVTAMAVLGTNLFAATHTGVYRTTNNGQNWTWVGAGLLNNIVHSLTVSGTTLFAGDNNGVWRSTNNGGSWMQVNNGLTNIYVYELAVLGSNLFAGTSGGGVFLSTNNGTNWTAVNNGLTNLNISCLEVSGTDLFAGLSSNGLFRSTDNGTSWHTVNNGLTNTNVTALTVFGINIFAGNQSSGIFRSTDNGMNWTDVNNGLTDKDVLSLAVSGTNLFAGTWGGGVFLSTNSGTNWTAVNNGLTSTYVYSFTVSGTNIFAGTGDEGVFLSTNNGLSWAAVNNGLTNSQVWALAVSRTNLFAGTFGGGIFLSTDSGTNWTSVNNGLTDLYVMTLAAMGEKIFAGTYGGGVFLSTNNGTTWTAVNNSLSNTYVHSLIVSGTNLFAGTDYVYEGGIYLSTDSGTSWALVNEGLTNTTIYSFAIGNGNLYAGTKSRSVWRRPLSEMVPSNGNIARYSFTGNANDSSGNGYHGTTHYNPQLVNDRFGYTASAYEFNGFNQFIELPSEITITSDLSISFWVNTTVVDTNSWPGARFLIDRDVCPGARDWSIGLGRGGKIQFQTGTGGLDDILTGSIDVNDNTWHHVVVIRDSAGQTKKIYIDSQLDTVSSFDDLQFQNNYLPIYFAATVCQPGTHKYFPGTIDDIRLYSRPLSEQEVELLFTEGGWIPPITFQLTVPIINGWNMVSVPGTNPEGMGVDTWWSGKDPAANVFKYGTGYQQVTSATPGEGYFMKHIGAQVYNTGDEWPAGGIQIVSHEPITGLSGWNLFGGYELVVGTAGITTVPPGLQNSPVYKYGAGYEIATTLEPGYGYWLKLTGAGQIIIPEVLAKETEPVEYFKEDWGKIILTDAKGVNYTLYAVKGEVDLNKFELPPLPLAGMFDIRFGSGRIAEDLNKNIQSIKMSGIQYPVIVEVENMNITLQDESGKEINTELKPREKLKISNKTINKLIILSGEFIAPVKYALEQNYPNPFNPTTTIKFSIPEVTKATLTIYNMLGERVSVLVNSELEAGNYSYQWNARNIATGLYIYELRTDKFVSVKKMLLLK